MSRRLSRGEEMETVFQTGCREQPADNQFANFVKSKRIENGRARENGSERTSQSRSFSALAGNGDDDESDGPQHALDSHVDMLEQ